MKAAQEYNKRKEINGKIYERIGRETKCCRKKIIFSAVKQVEQ